MLELLHISLVDVLQQLAYIHRGLWAGQTLLGVSEFAGTSEREIIIKVVTRSSPWQYIIGASKPSSWGIIEMTS